MRQQSRLTAITLGYIFTLAAAICTAQQPVQEQPMPVAIPTGPSIKLDVAKTPKCDAGNVSGYKGGKCYITIDRSKPASVPSLPVPNGTAVEIDIINSRWNETTTFNTTTTQLASQDIFLALLKNFLGPLQALIASQHRVGSLLETNNPINDEQKIIEDKLGLAQLKLNNVAAELTCLETYNVWVPSSDWLKIGLCQTTAYLESGTFVDAKKLVLKDIAEAISVSLPSAEIADVDTKIAKFLTDCKAAATTPTETLQCNDLYDAWKSNQSRYVAFVADVNKSIETLTQNQYILQNWQGSPTVATYNITQPKNRSSTITISVSEIVTKTPVTLATVALVWQSSPWVFSTGAMFSTLPNRIYSIVPVINSNGTVSTPSGSTDINTQIAENDTLPSVLAPFAQVNYNFRAINQRIFGSTCAGHCALLVSFGAGPNLVTKSADFGAGVALRVGGVLLAPMADFGRENFLSGGLVPNQALGTKPPSSLPQHTEWKTHVGFSLTYVIPLPQ